MADYVVHAFDLVTGAFRDTIPFDTITYGRALNAAGSFTGTLSTRHPKCKKTILDPGRTALYVQRNGVCVWSGILWNANAISGDQGVTTFGAEGFFSYWLGAGGNTSHGIFIRTTGGFAAGTVSLAAAARSYISAIPFATYNVNFGLLTNGVGTEPNYAQLIFNYDYQRVNVGALVQSFANQPSTAGAFDFDFTSDLTAGTPVTTFTTYTAKQGVLHADMILQLGVNLADGLEWSLDGTQQATFVEEQGSSSGSSTPAGSALLGSLATSGYPRLEYQTTDSSVTNAAVLATRATALLAAYKAPVQTLPTCQVIVDNLVTNPAGWTMGDTLRVQARDGYIQFNGIYRIVADNTQVDAGGNETVQLTFQDPGAFA